MILEKEELRLAAEIVRYMQDQPAQRATHIAEKFCISVCDAERILNHLRRLHTTKESYQVGRGYAWSLA